LRPAQRRMLACWILEQFDISILRAGSHSSRDPRITFATRRGSSPDCNCASAISHTPVLASAIAGSRCPPVYGRRKVVTTRQACKSGRCVTHHIDIERLAVGVSLQSGLCATFACYLFTTSLLLLRGRRCGSLPGCRQSFAWLQIRHCLSFHWPPLLGTPIIATGPTNPESSKGESAL
jgi:hypothetical protein